MNVVLAVFAAVVTVAAVAAAVFVAAGFAADRTRVRLDWARSAADEHVRAALAVLADARDTQRTLLAVYGRLLDAVIGLSEKPSAVTSVAQLERFRTAAATAPRSLIEFMEQQARRDPDLYGPDGEVRVPVGLDQ